ncbi:outer membrane protein assembly factor [Flavobacteriaceae bacterium AU392]|nr:outer membrane protein assembly factor [Flavobacteriaceae bacterium]RKM84124.1 outer membrane protein assembly factor [Flavobacteriaceae bacterium AU392]
MLKQLLLFIILVISFSGNAQELEVAELYVRGNKRLKTSFIRLISDTKAGVKLDSIIIEQDIIRLKRLPAVSHAYYQIFYSHENKYNVFFYVEENFTLNPQLSLYTTNNDEFAFRTGLYEFNTLGRNITFGGFFQRDVFNSYGINLRAPFLFNNKIGLALNFQDLTTQEPVFLNNGSAEYRYNNTSFEVLGLYAFNFHHRIELGITLFNEDYEYLFGATDPSIPQDFNLDKQLYKGVYEYNDLDYYYQYVKGFKSTLNVQYVTTNNNQENSATLPDFLIFWNDFLYFKRVGERGNWANRLRIGLASNPDSPFAPFSVDNNLNVRGVGNTIDRGTGVILVNTEYRYTLFEKETIVFQGNGFIDAGTWRNPGGDFSDFGNSQNVRIYPGIGFRFIHKKIFNATFRVDYGFGITRDATNGLVFGVGQYF